MSSDLGCRNDTQLLDLKWARHEWFIVYTGVFLFMCGIDLLNRTSVSKRSAQFAVLEIFEGRGNEKLKGKGKNVSRLDKRI